MDGKVSNSSLSTATENAFFPEGYTDEVENIQLDPEILIVRVLVPRPFLRTRLL